MTPCFNDIVAFLQGTYRPGEVYEIRGLTKYGFKNQVGYFNNPVDAANAVVANDTLGMAGYYVTINTVSPNLLARVNNRLMDGAKAGNYTSDNEVPHRSSVFIDIDPSRESGISSTDAEHQAAISYAYQIDWILQTFYGWPPACIIDSGNGAHLRWRTETIANDANSLMLVRGFLQHTKKLFEVPGLTFDAGNFNASRIARLPGTPTRKGENLPDRPHRLSRVLRPGDLLAPLVTQKQIEALSKLPEANGSKSGSSPYIIKMKSRDVALYRRINRVALTRLDDWVPYLLGNLARKSGEKYRISSRDLGRPLEEDISIHPKGITDWGLWDMGELAKGYRTAVQLLAELSTDGSLSGAAELLSLTINEPVTEFTAAPLMGGIPSELLGGDLLQYDLNNAFAQNVAQAQYKPMTWQIEGLIPSQQYVMLHANPKVGKSTMARQMAVATAMGLEFMYRKVTQGKVLYLTYEEDEARWRDGIKDTYRWMAQRDGYFPTQADYDKLFDNIKVMIKPSQRIGEAPPPDRVLPRGVEGIKAIKAFVDNDPTYRLVVLDPYESLFDDVYTRDIKKQHRFEGEQIKTIYQNNSCSVIVVDHSKKEVMRSDPLYVDVLNSTSGTAQKPATADMIIAINALPPLPSNESIPGMTKGAKLAYMRVSGRYVEEMTLKVEFEGPLGWTELGDDFPMPSAKEIQEQTQGRGAKPLDPELQGKIVTVLEREGGKSAKDLCRILNTGYQRVRRAIGKLMDLGRVGVIKELKEHIYYILKNGHKLLDIL